MPYCISLRQSIRWLPDDASEPTNTVVLTASKTGCFIDVRFIKGTNQLDWAFAGYRSSIHSNSTRFTHWIDSRTMSPLEVDDHGTNITLPDGTTLETGSMVNPLTGRSGSYEEIWKDEESESGLFIRNTRKTKWHARVGARQVALGRDEEGRFAAWQAEQDRGEVRAKWELKYSTEGAGSFVKFLPEGTEVKGWLEDERVEWNGDEWDILEHSD